MKVLFIGVYKDGTGWANSAIDTILALDTAGVDVVCRPLKLNNRKTDIPKRISELENKNIKGCTHVIQNVLPHHMSYSGEFEKNIAIYMSETSHFRNTSWPEHLSLMDEAWVPCRQMIDSARKSNVACPLKIIPVPCDTSKYQKKYRKIDLPGDDEAFRFYFIGEFTKRKNVSALLKAFHLEFNPTDKVQLVIKASIPGKTTSQSERIIRETCNKVKNSLKIYRSSEMYHEEMIISSYFTDEQIMRLHSTCDCFVMPSYGEAWCIPAFDAMAMGKTPICTNVGGPTDYLYKASYSLLPKYYPDGPIKKYSMHPTQNQIEHGYENLLGVYDSVKCGWLIECQPEPCYEVNDTLDDIYVSNENWQSINIQKLREAMREVYEDRQEQNKRAEQGRLRAYDFSHLIIGNEMKEAIKNEHGNSKLCDWSSEVREKYRM